MSGLSIMACKVALSRDPGNPGLMVNLAQSLLDANRPEEAEPLLRELLVLDPRRPGLRTALGNVLKQGSRYLEASAEYRAALIDHPEDLAARYNLAIIALLQGRLLEGWAGRELRWLAGGTRPREFREPPWQGGPLEGRTLLLHGAQEGLGDAIMALRYAEGARARGGRILVECHPSLVELFRACPFTDEVVACGEPLPSFECQALLMSLPGVFRTELGTIPWTGPYLKAPAPAALGAGFKVGLVFMGNPGHPEDAQRSIPPDLFGPLAALRPRCAFFSLQKRREGLPPLPESLGALDLGDRLEDFAATANFLEGLDLLVTVDTSVAHLAGAMGRKVKLLLPFQPDWRWLLEREDSPWYPSFRLYRQEAPGDWETVVERLVRDLAHEA